MYTSYVFINFSVLLFDSIVLGSIKPESNKYFLNLESGKFDKLKEVVLLWIGWLIGVGKIGLLLDKFPILWIYSLFWLTLFLIILFIFWGFCNNSEVFEKEVIWCELCGELYILFELIEFFIVGLLDNNIFVWLFHFSK